MTNKEVRALFATGQKVLVTRTGGTPLVVHGNTGTSVLPANDVAGEERVVQAVKSAEWVFVRPNGSKVHTTYPLASEVQEARPGYVRFAYKNGLVVTISAV